MKIAIFSAIFSESRYFCLSLLFVILMCLLISGVCFALFYDLGKWDFTKDDSQEGGIVGRLTSRKKLKLL